MRIIEDKGNKVGKHNIKNLWWSNNKVEVLRAPLPVGDYVLINEKIQDVIDRKTKRNIELKKMDFLGTYSIAVDTKCSIQELVQDIQSEHDRFRDELILAQNNSISLYIVVENKGTYLNSKRTIWNEDIHDLKGLYSWKNPRAFIFRAGKQLYPNCAKGEWIAKCCITMEKKYGCKFVFCTPEESAKIITDILQGEYKCSM